MIELSFVSLIQSSVNLSTVNKVIFITLHPPKDNSDKEMKCQITLTNYKLKRKIVRSHSFHLKDTV